MMQASRETVLMVADIRPLIHEIRGVQVILDRDLARLYGVTTGALNQAVKRNLERFPERFMFQMTEDEFKNWKSQSVISNQHESTIRMGLRTRPHVFTEYGVAMLAAVLRSETAVRVSLEIIDAFITMRKMLSSMAPRWDALARQLDTVERRQITDQSRNEARFEEIFTRMGEGDVPPAQIFYQGKFWDAKSLLIKIIRRAKKELIVIDAYVGTATLDMLAKRGRGVKIELVTHSNGDLADSDYEAFTRQCGKFTKTICGICHDRFIVIDQTELFWSGASLKDAGRLTFAVAQMDAGMIPGLLDSIRKSSTSRTR